MATVMTEKSSHDEPKVPDFITIPEGVDTVSERKLLWKIDVHLLPILSLLYLCAFIDRINIGNAKIQGMEKDLGMKGQDYNIALFVFFPGYILLEMPANLILKRVRPSRWLSGIMVAWGIITVCQGVTQSFAGLVTCRVLLGICECGFVPGSIYLISMYYKRYELQWRVNLFFCASILSGAFSGLLAYAIAHMAGVGGYGGWRWIFILEGLFTIIVAAIALFFIPDWPEQVTFLTPDEHQQLIHRLAADAGVGRMSHWTKATAKQVFTDFKIYVATFAYFGVVNTGYALSFFLPTILKELGWTSIRAQVMTIPIYIVAAVVCATVGYVTDVLKHRFLFTLLGCCVATIGYGILLNMRSVPVGARYFAVYTVVTGGYITQPVILAWLSNQMGGHYKRGLGPAIMIGLGNCAGLVASNIYLPQQAPTYKLGFGLSLGFIWLTAISCIIFFVILVRENRLREKGGRDYRLRALNEEELKNLGDAHPGFRFSY